MKITPKQAQYILDAIDWAVNDGMAAPDFEQSQIMMQLNFISIEEKNDV
tara:strand:- start:11275 stop:11421 length:147 start_codon:yes stop_codon:yes gene_type:complete